jgi:hypothetical protein
MINYMYIIVFQMIQVYLWKADWDVCGAKSKVLVPWKLIILSCIIRCPSWHRQTCVTFTKVGMFQGHLSQ